MIRLLLLALFYVIGTRFGTSSSVQSARRLSVAINHARSDVEFTYRLLMLNQTRLGVMKTRVEMLRFDSRSLSTTQVGIGELLPVIPSCSNPSMGVHVQNKFISPYASSTRATLGQNFFSLSQGSG